MSSPADILYTWLEVQGVFVSPWQAFVAFLPNSPDNAICVFDVEGKPDGRIMATGKVIEHPGVTLQFRSLDYTVGWEKANSVALLLDSLRRVVVDMGSNGAYTLHNVSRYAPVLSLGVEMVNDRRRHLFSINTTITVTEETD